MIKKIIVLTFLTLSISAFAQTPAKPDPNSMINAEEQINGLPGAGDGKSYSVRTKKRAVKAPDSIAPVIENDSPANCASNMGGKGAANFTACEAAKKNR